MIYRLKYSISLDTDVRLLKLRWEKEMQIWVEICKVSWSSYIAGKMQWLEKVGVRLWLDVIYLDSRVASYNLHNTYTDNAPSE